MMYKNKNNKKYSLKLLNMAIGTFHLKKKEARSMKQRLSLIPLSNSSIQNLNQFTASGGVLCVVFLTRKLSQCHNIH